MFCPKCGTKNPEDGKFCRSCGSDITAVSAVMTSGLPAKMGDFGIDVSCDPKDALRRKDPHEVYGDGIKGMITGIGFLVVSLSLLFTGVANGRVWWWALLFPAFFGFAKGVSDLMKSRKMLETRRAAFVPQTGNSLRSAPDHASLHTAREEFIPPATRYQTDDLVPSSVTDNTTRHLEINVEGETMALPKK